MIDKEKIEQGAIGCTVFAGHKAATYVGFKAGVAFAETELQNIAIEFAEWCNAHDYIQYSTQQLAEITTSELFAKFMAERVQE